MKLGPRFTGNGIVKKTTAGTTVWGQKRKTLVASSRPNQNKKSGGNASGPQRKKSQKGPLNVNVILDFRCEGAQTAVWTRAGNSSSARSER